MRKHLTSLAILLLCASSFISSTQGQRCLGLALQGGGDKGAYHAGALEGLFHSLSPEETQYDVVSGVSVGALNAGLISQFPKGEEAQMVKALAEFWSNVKASNFYKQWLGGIVQGLLYKPSMYNTEPTDKFLESQFKSPPQRFISIGTTDVNTAKFKTFTNFNEELTPEKLVKSVKASFAIAGAFPFVEIEGRSYIDGGAVMSLDIGSVVHKCREITGDRDEDITIDVILLSGKHYKAQNASNYHGIQMLFRAIELMSYHSSLGGLVQAQSSFPDVKFRYIIQPKSALPDSLLPIAFNHKDLELMLDEGRKDATDAVRRGPFALFNEAIEDARKHLFGPEKIKEQNLIDQYLREVEKELRKEWVESN